MIRLGWAALRDPSHTRFWTDSTGLWLTNRLLGDRTAKELEQGLRGESRTKQRGIVGIIIGTFFLVAAIVVGVLVVLGAG
jgi:hypothetical protein